MLKEMPQVGDVIRYVGDNRLWLTRGKTYEIEGIDVDGDPFFLDDDGNHEFFFPYKLHIYELVSQATPDTAALIANLALRVGELEKENAQQALEINELYRAYVGREARL